MLRSDEARWIRAVRAFAVMLVILPLARWGLRRCSARRGLGDPVVAYVPIPLSDQVGSPATNAWEGGTPPLPKRWTVERTYGWLVFRRRLARDYVNQRPAAPARHVQHRSGQGRLPVRADRDCR